MLISARAGQSTDPSIKAERRLYTLRDQLKIQFRATQKAQVNERRAADSKRRLTS